MGVASLAGQTFRLDPTSISWGFKSKVSDIPTVGGKVVQVFGTEVSDMTLAGTFGVGGWREQEAFLERMKKLGDETVASYGQMQSTRMPHRFLYPGRGWDFLVYLKGYTTPDGGRRSIHHSNEVVAPKWSLTLFIVEDNSGLKKVAQDSYIARLSKGLGWKQTEYNGPMGSLEFQESLGGGTVKDYLAREFGLHTGAPAGNQMAVDGAGSAPTDTTALQEMVRQKAAAVGWTGAEWDALYAIVQKESSWNPNAQNPTSTAYGLFQFLNGTWGNYSSHQKSSDPAVQTDAGLAYIRGRYMTPTAAWAFHQRNNYY